MQSRMSENAGCWSEGGVSDSNSDGVNEIGRAWIVTSELSLDEGGGIKSWPRCARNDGGRGEACERALCFIHPNAGFRVQHLPMQVRQLDRVVVEYRQLACARLLSTSPPIKLSSYPPSTHLRPLPPGRAEPDTRVRQPRLRAPLRA